MSDPTIELASIPRLRVGCLSFSVLPLGRAIDLLFRRVSGRSSNGTAVHFANAYNIALADADPTYRALVNRGDLVFSDGTPVVWAGRRLHPKAADQWTRVYGPDVMAGVLDRCERDRGGLAATADGEPRHYLLGGTPEVLDSLRRVIGERWPGARIVGADSPPFRAATPDDLAKRDRRIQESGATCVWVGLGTPKQDYEVRRLADALPVTAVAVGAAFDFIAGTTKQAPAWMQRGGLEWCFRLAQEPRRLTRRYLWGNPRFVYSVARQRLNKAL